MKEKPICLIAAMKTEDILTVWFTCILLTILNIAVLSCDIILICKIIYFAFIHLGKLFTNSPSIKIVIMFAILFLFITILTAIFKSGVGFVLDLVGKLLDNKLYKMIMLDNDTKSIISVKYRTLDWLTENGYKILDNIDDNTKTKMEDKLNE